MFGSPQSWEQKYIYCFLSSFSVLFFLFSLCGNNARSKQVEILMKLEIAANPSYTSSLSEITKTNVTTKRQHPNKQNQKLRKKEKREKPESFFCNTLRPVVHWKKSYLRLQTERSQQGVGFFTSFELIGELNPARSCLLNKTK